MIRYNDHLHKIGWAIVPERRLGVLRKKHGPWLEIVKTWNYPFEDIAFAELRAHRILEGRWADDLFGLEWFYVDAVTACMAVELAIRISRDGPRPDGRARPFRSRAVADMAVELNVSATELRKKFGRVASMRETQNVST